LDFEKFDVEYFLAVLIAASTASAPEFVKKTFSANVF